jgi:glutamate--cysteine ligase
LNKIDERLRALPQEALPGIRRGIEKESLRVDSDGRLSIVPHASGLGSALTHPHITTDFSESQLELITSPCHDIDACLEQLTQIHQFVAHHIGDEMLWCSSMPCGLPVDDAIPLGRYGKSNIGLAKTVYRMGLSHRYGRRMQTISGIHYNFSMPGISNEGYFALIRNFRRHSWLLLYLFGCSPAVCSSFVKGRDHTLEELTGNTLYRPYGTSIRMGPLGYQSSAQAALAVSYNCLGTYGASLEDGMTRSYPPYEEIGLRGSGADTIEGYRQLATTLLQIENEFYGTIRPKRIIRRGERPLHALRERGVEYIEVRLMDLSPYEPIGIDAATMRFLDVFLLHCLLRDSPPDTEEENAAMLNNLHLTAARGREPGLVLEWEGKEMTLAQWGRRTLADCEPVAAALDRTHRTSAYRDALSAAAAALADPTTVPSARVLADMERDHHNSYVAFALARSKQHRDTLRGLALAPDVEARFSQMAEHSLAEQRRIEAADTLPFETFRQQYLSRDKLIV